MAGVLVHEWISKTGGSEKVLDAMAATFPDADVLTLWNDDADQRYPGRCVSESWLARTPLRRSKAAALPFMPLAWRRLAVRDVDWALVSSHLFAHHATFTGPAAQIPKFVYVHTPARYIWTPELDERGRGLIPRAGATVLRPFDRRRAQEAHAVAANSAYVRERIAATWERDATVIHPPVDVDRIRSVTRWADVLTDGDRAVLESLPQTYLLGASRFIPYKRLDLVIAAGEQAGLPVVLAGSGPLRDELRARAQRARVQVVVVDRPSDHLLYALFQEALVYVFPAVEDFGIMPVEAMAAGTPVVVPAVGGAAESVVDGVTGAVWHDGTSLGDAVARAATADPDACRSRAADFGPERFERELRTWMGLEDVVGGGRHAA